MRKIPYSYLDKQFADPSAILARIKRVVATGDFTLGEELKRFEQQFARSLGGAHAVGVNSGTDALFLALKALGVHDGEVIVPAYSFFATAAVVAHVGARPRFVDVGLDFNLDPVKAEAAINSKTRAIIPVHWAGRPCDMEVICRIASNNGVPVIEDAAQAYGSWRGGRPCGLFGSFGAFSLHPLKTLNIWGDGGVIVTQNDDLAETVSMLRNHGLANRDVCVEWGYNSRLDSIQAVVARAGLDKFDHVMAVRRANARKLDEMLADVDGVSWVPMPDNAQSNYYLYTVLVADRNALVKHLEANDIEAKVHYPIPLHLQPAARSLGYKAGDFPLAERCANETISLPIHEYVSEDDLERMAETIRGFYRQRAAA